MSNVFDEAEPANSILPNSPYSYMLHLEDNIPPTLVSVFIAGAGGLGSPVALYLAAAGLGIPVISLDHYRAEVHDRRRGRRAGFWSA